MYFCKIILNYHNRLLYSKATDRRRIQKLHFWLKGQVTDIWMPRQATSSSLTAPHAALLRPNPKGRWPSQEQGPLFGWRFYTMAVLPAGIKQALKCIASHFYVVLFYLLTHLFIQSRLFAQALETAMKKDKMLPTKRGKANINHRVI